MKMRPYKEFSASQRKLELKEPYLITTAQVTPTLYEYAKILHDNKIVQGECQKYSGVVQEVISKFINYWAILIDACVKETNDLRCTANIKTLLALVANTLKVQQRKQEEFKEIFVSPRTSEEQKVLEEIEELYEARIKDLQILKDEISNFNTQKEIEDFMDYHFKLAIAKTNEIFSQAQTDIAIEMEKHTDKIILSFQDILIRLKNNLNQMKQESVDIKKKLFTDLYEMNKDRTKSYRIEDSWQRMKSIAETDSAIKQFGKKIKLNETSWHLERLEEEVTYREKKIAEFQDLVKTIKILKEEHNDVTEYLRNYKKKRIIEITGSTKQSCWYNIGENFSRRLKYLKEAFVDACKSLLSFFAVPDRTFHKDNVSIYTIDRYGHQIYIFNYGKETCHLTCDGKYVEVSDFDKYYFDRNGRYQIDDNGEKVHKCASCSSSYKLCDDLFVKVTKDCGHSEIPNPKCGLLRKDQNIFELLPEVEPIDIKQTVTPDVVKYVWDVIGYVLPDALHHVGVKRPLNPIYYLANRLIYYKYRTNTAAQIQEKIAEANKYKADILNSRKESMDAAANVYKAKQVQRRKPEESDDREDNELYATRAKLRDQLTRYNDY